MARRPLVAAVAALTLAALLTSPGATVQAAAPTVHFTAAGDYTAGSNASLVLNAIGAAAPEAHLALGDLSYGSAGAEQAWCDFVTARVGAGFPFQLLSGNHESNGVNGNINDFAACLPNQLPGLVGTYGRQWYADYPKGNPTVRFVMISPGLTYPDGAWSYAAGSARYQWTAAAIDGARTAGIPWVVVGMHKPCLTMGFIGKIDVIDYIEPWIFGAAFLNIINISLVILLASPLSDARLAVILGIAFCYAFPTLVSFEPRNDWLDILNPIRPGIFFYYGFSTFDYSQMLSVPLTIFSGLLQVLIVWGGMVLWHRSQN